MGKEWWSAGPAVHKTVARRYMETGKSSIADDLIEGSVEGKWRKLIKRTLARIKEVESGDTCFPWKCSTCLSSLRDTLASYREYLTTAHDWPERGGRRKNPLFNVVCRAKK